MKWEGQEQSRNVEDRRSGGMGGVPRLGGRRGLGLGSIVIALVVGWIFGINPLTVLGLMGGMGGESGSAEVAQQAPAQSPPAGDRAAAFVSTVLRDTELVWGRQFGAQGQAYQEPRLVLFRGAIPSACGMGQSAMGPFYCPGDRKVYLDLAFYDELATRFQAPGDFAQAYVLAHEVGHHVQNLVGTLGQVQSAKQRLSEGEQNQLQVRVELQADCYAGIWAHYAERSSGILEPGDIDEGLRAASAVGDDTIQRRMQGHVVPESFTHGSAEQRMSWFMRGFESGRLESCDTFAAR